MMRFFLLQHKMDIKATQSEKYDFVMSIANGQVEIDQITEWIKGKASQD
jgi:prophage maintenance system killer protein